MRKSLLTFVMCLLYVSIVNAQNTRVVDSLKNQLQLLEKSGIGKSTKVDTNVVQTLYMLARNLAFNEPKQAKEYCLKASLLLDSLQKNTKTISKAYYEDKYPTLCKALSVICDQLGDYPSAIAYLKSSYKYLDEKKDFDDIVKWNNALSNFYSRIGENKLAITHAYKGLKIAEQNNYEPGICSALRSIAVIYSYQDKHNEALPYYLRIVKIREKNNEVGFLPDDYNNLANTYDEIGKTKEALEYLLKALKIAREQKSLDQQALTLNNLSYYYIDKDNPKLALEYASEANKINKEINDVDGVIKTLQTIATCHFLMKDYAEAVAMAKEGLEQSKKIGNLNNIQNFNELLFQYNQHLGDYKSALEYHIDFMKMKDSLFNMNVAGQMNEMETKYETDKKEKENQLLQTQNQLSSSTIKQQKITGYFIIAGLVLTLFLAFFIFKGLKNQRAANKIISHQKELVEEKHKEITDSINYAERIQRSFLATDELLNAHLKNYFVLFQPKDVVSGDFYWAATIQDSKFKTQDEGTGAIQDSFGKGKFILVTADSTGHGVPGAIMSILNISSLEKAVESGLTEPSEIFNHTRKTIIDRLKKDGSPEGGKDGMDASLVCFDFENLSMKYSAANNPVWIVRGSELIELSPDKMPVGKHDKDQIPFSQKEFTLQKDDLIYTLTDGLPDQFGGPKGKKFMYKQLKELLIANASLGMNEQKQALQNALSNWKQTLEQVDDITLIGVKVV